MYYLGYLIIAIIAIALHLYLDLRKNKKVEKILKKRRKQEMIANYYNIKTQRSEIELHAAYDKNTEEEVYMVYILDEVTEKFTKKHFGKQIGHAYWFFNAYCAKADMEQRKNSPII